MMTVMLLPRLSPISVDQILDERFDDANPLESFEHAASVAPHAVRYAEVGGSVTSDFELKALRTDLVEIAKQHGFPQNKDDMLQFDIKVASYLINHRLLQDAESLRDDVWAGLTTWLLGDLCFWRFGNRRHRFQGGNRNCFQRLFIRARAFDSGNGGLDRFELMSQLSEDAMVQITERTVLVADQRVALAIAKGWQRMATLSGRNSMESIMRKAIIGIRVINEVYCLALLPDQLLGSLIDAEFKRAAAPSATVKQLSRTA